MLPFPESATRYWSATLGLNYHTSVWPYPVGGEEHYPIVVFQGPQEYADKTISSAAREVHPPHLAEWPPSLQEASSPAETCMTDFVLSVRKRVGFTNVGLRVNCVRLGGQYSNN